jgi:addiction module HigA family antidote
MIPENRVSTHPGEILKYEFLEPLGQTQSGLAKHLGIPVQRINELVRGKRGVTPDTAWLLSQAFDTTPEFWMNLQNSFDLSSNRPKAKIQSIMHNKSMRRTQ